MSILLLSLIILCISRQCSQQIMLDHGVDDIFDFMLPDVDERMEKLKQITARHLTSLSIPTLEARRRNRNKETLFENSFNVTEPSINHNNESQTVTIPPFTESAMATLPAEFKKKYKEKDMEEVKRRIGLLEFEYFMNNSDSPLASLHANTDEIDELNKRLDILSEGKPPNNETRRKSPTAYQIRKKKKKHDYNYNTEYGVDFPEWYIKGKNVTINVMLQVIYSARYRMPYSQLLRKRYGHDVKFKLGFCFALLRLLKQQQMYVYHSFQYRQNFYETYMASLKTYERILRLQVDVRDVIKLIKELDMERKKKEVVNYYYFFPKSTGTAYRRKHDESDLEFTTPMSSNGK